MLPSMRPEVDPGHGDLEEGEEGRLEPRLVPDQGENASVVVLVRLDVEDADARPALQGIDGFIDDAGPAPLADVGNGFDDPWHVP